MGGSLGYVVVGVIAALVAGAELTSRYTDRPGTVLRRPATSFYVLVNVAGGLLALYATRAFDWKFGMSTSDAVSLVRVAIAGLSALALFRLKLFSAAQGDQTISFGPSRLLEQLLAVADRQLDRGQASDRAVLVQEVSQGVSFPKAAQSLPAQALALLENVDEEAQEQLGEDVKSLVEDDVMEDAVKVRLLVTAVLRVAGPEVVRTAIEALGETIRE